MRWTALLILLASSLIARTQNPIVTENALTGNPKSEWDISGSGDASIQGFATDISVNKGETVRFKIKTTASAYTINIYRLGYYNGNGARKVGTGVVTATLPQSQPNPLENATTGLVDCGNWSESARWDVPSTAVSGVYIALLKRTDNGGASHIIFIVRDDASTSKLFFQTSDATWQAYNVYGGNSLYVGSTSFPGGHAAKVSYNRPFITRAGGGGGGAAEDWIFNAEFPMIRFLERNGFDVSYTTNVDAARRGNLILNHKVFLSVGHDEYWSAEQRASVEAARNAGVHLAFFSGNEIYWKTRWENSTDASGTPYRTLVCYKEGTLGENVCGGKCDPNTAWTGLWRDGCAYPSGGACLPENAVSGQISWDGTTTAIQVPSTYKALRFWRNTSVASLSNGQTATFTAGTLGYEWNWEQYENSYPSGRITMSSTTSNGHTHKLSLYRHSSGALVFGAGTVQWSWGLDNVHDRGSAAATTAMQQATVNLFADMGVQPATLMSGLTAATASTDLTAPTCTITSPTNGASTPAGTTLTISGTATEAGGGVLVGVEVSVDGGVTWKSATGTTSWTYVWTPSISGTANIRVRGFDDSGNMGVPGSVGSSSNININITGASTTATSIFQPTDVPAVPTDNDGIAIEVGMKFRSTIAGNITGVRYYKGAGVTGTHTGHLWTSTGTLLAEATFVNETSSGWQQVLFSSPVAINPGTTYVVSYFSAGGYYSVTNPYFTQAVVNGQLRGLATGEDGGNGLYLYTNNSAFPTNNFQSSNYWVDVVFSSSTSVDNTPPTVSSVTPKNAATGVIVNSNITAVFSESISPTSVTSATVELRNASNALVANTMSVSGSQLTITPNSALSDLTTYTVKLVGGSSGIKDLAGNALASDYSWTFTTAAASAPTSNIFGSAVPSAPRNNDGVSIEVGVKFRSSQNGYVTGIRYYKASGFTGTRTGHLWSSAGVKLGEATFSSETTSGWQQVLFSSPVAITANTTYVASYFSSSGDYTVTNPYFTSAVVNGQLRALANGEDGGNGVYSYTSTFVMPANTYQTSNYWVDVVFVANVAPDVTPPTITAVSPPNGVTGVTNTTTVTATFSEAINTATVTSATFELRNAANAVVPAVISVTSNQITLTPSSALSYSSVYTARVVGGTSGVKDLAGNALASDYTWSFTVSDPPPPIADGTGGPILVVSTSANPFSRYTVEMLRAEGLNGFAAKDISAVTEADLNNYDVVILGEMTITSAQATMFTNWVNAGGTLVAFRPSTQLSTLFGITKVSGTLSDQYLLVNTAAGAGVGIVAQTIQFHGAADLYTLSGATTLATLYSSATTATSNPAVTTRDVGSNGGRAIAFMYDLAKSIVYTRQGNPAWVGQERDSQPPIRSDDLFFGNGLPDWVNLNKVAIPQADEQQRLLTNIIIQGNLHRKPLPRFWFLPRGLKAAIVMTGDDHATGGTGGRFNQYLTLGPNTAQDVADWKAVRSTSYIYPGTPITNAQAAAFEAQGFEISLHLTTNCLDYTATSFQSNLVSQLATFKSQYPSLSSPVTHRTHCLVWSDWASQPKIDRQNGIRMDASYYYWPGEWVQNRSGMFTGSGMPMRFADSDGSLIDCYQLPTQMTDESGITLPGFCDQLLDKALGSEGYYGVFCANMHTDFVTHTGSDAIIASAQARQVPIVSTRQMLTWVDGRNGSSFGTMTWNNNQLTFPVTALSGAYNLNGMLPFNSANGPLASITRNGTPISFTTQTIKGILYAFFDIPVGTNTFVASYTPINSAPAVTTQPASQTICVGNNVSFTSAASGAPTPTVQWQQSTDGGTNWTNISGATASPYTFTPTVADNGKRYRAVWTNSLGSANSNAAILTVNATPGAPTITVADNCGSTLLTAGSFTGSLLWNTGATSSAITVTTGGSYTVAQTLNGCVSPSGTATAAPKTVPSAPTVIVTNNCGNSVLTATNVTGSLLWSNGATTSSITVTAGGTYTVTQTVNGCVSTAGTGTAAPKAIPGAPTVTVVDNCGSSVLTASNYTGALLWSNGATTPSINVTTGGVYTVTQTINGCTSAAGTGTASPLVSNVPAPTISVTNNCGTSVLTASNYTGTLLWSNGATTSSITVNTAATYSLTQIVGGCASPSANADALPLTVPNAPTVTVNNTCNSSVLTASNYTGTLLWSNGATTPSITVATGGTYTVSQTVNGCSSITGSGVAAPVTPPSTPTISASGATIFCQGGSVTLTSSATTGTHLWSTGATTRSITVSANGNYTVSNTLNGCSSAVSTPQTVTVNPTPAGTISSASGTMCDNGVASVTFNATSGTGPYQVVINGTTYSNVNSGSSITTNVAAPASVSLWPNTTIPTRPLDNDGVPIELGTKFRTSVNGTVRALRFYKGSNADGSTYVLKLYQSSNSTLLASVNFTNTTATGWQTVNLATPVAVTANTTYTVSYYSPAGNYAYNDTYFTSAVVNGPLTGLANNTDGANGVYRYGSGGGIPTTGYQSTNYWADLVFAPSTVSLSLTSITDSKGCTVTGSLGTVNLTVVSCGLLTSVKSAVTAESPTAETSKPALELQLGQNRPNPFHSSTLIDIVVPKTERVKLALYDANGKLVQVLLNEVKEAGAYVVPVDRKTLAAGIYYYMLESGNERRRKKMIVL